MANGHNAPMQSPLSAAPAVGAVQGDDAFDTFYRDNFDEVVNLFNSRGRRVMEDDVEELAQESLTRFLPYVRSHPVAAWRPMLYRIALNLVRERWRRVQMRYTLNRVPLDDVLQSEEDEPASDAPGPDEVAAQGQQAARLAEAVRALPKQCRKVYVLRFVEGLTNAAIAKRLLITERMVEKHIANSMAHIHRALDRRQAGA